MRFLIFSAYDPIPSDQTAYTRYAYLAEELASHGHEVIYITSSFYHTKKKQRAESGWSTKNKKVQLHLLKSPSYERNVGIGRILNHYVLNKQLKNFLASLENIPDLIVAASPPLSTANTLLKWAKSKNIPSILDIQDLWPDAWEQFIPKPSPTKELLNKWRKTAESNIELATAFASVSNDYLPKATKKPAKVFYLGSRTQDFAHPSKKDDLIRLVHLGSYQTNSPLTSVISILGNKKNVELTVIGLGAKTEQYRHYASQKGFSNISFIDWMPPNELKKELPKYTAGIAILNTSSKSALPNRVFAYFAAGLPIISNMIGGELEMLIQTRKAGVIIKDLTEESLLSAVSELSRFTPEQHAEIQRWAQVNFDVKDIYANYAEWLISLAEKK